MSFAGSVSLQRRNHVQRLFWHAFFWFALIFIGFRHEVGTDWSNYLSIWESRTGLFSVAISQTEPLYYILMYIVKQAGLSIHWLNLLTSAVAITPIFYYLSKQKNQWIGLSCLIPVLFVISLMGYNRQAPAIGLVVWAVFRFLDKKIFSSLLIISLATLFHNSALIMMPILFGFAALYRGWIVKITLTAIIAIFSAYFRDSILGRIILYTDGSLFSAGALPRILLIDISLVLALIYYKKLTQDEFQRQFVLYFCACGLFLSCFLVVDSVMADRAILYWVAIQLLVYGNVSGIFQKNGNRVFIWLGLVLVHLIVLLFWLFYGTFAEYWLPYRNFLFI